MNESTPDRERFRRTLVKVWTMQIVALLLLGLLQYTFRP
jgi:hypothetical protein